jgi:hypothetical protein
LSLIAIDCHTSECRPVSLDEQLAVAKAAQALRLLGAIKGFSAPAAVLEVRL